MPGPNVPFPPMEASLVRELPRGDEWQYEPKWDGFRGVLENDGGELALWSRKERPLLRYFPELRPLGDLLPPHSALDGEIVIARDGVLDFDSMQMRLHPAESRIRKLSARDPGPVRRLRRAALGRRRGVAAPAGRAPRACSNAGRGRRLRLSPYTLDVEEAAAWIDDLEAAGLDGVIAKRRDEPYRAGSREAVAKVKAYRSADCVVVGIRWKEGAAAASPRCCSASTARRASCTTSARRPSPRASTTRSPRASCRSSTSPRTGASRSRTAGAPASSRRRPLRPELVAEVRYDKVQGLRLRHGTKLLRFREDKDPADCTWRELRPPRDANALTVESLLGKDDRRG